MLAFLGRVVVGTGRFAVRNVLIPIALTALAAAVLKSIADRIPDDTGDGMSYEAGAAGPGPAPGSGNRSPANGRSR